MTKATYSRINVTVSTWKRSIARRLPAWERRKERHGRCLAGGQVGRLGKLGPVRKRYRATKALDTVRREVWQDLRRQDPAAAKRFKGACWCRLKNPKNLDDAQAANLRRMRRRGGDLWRAHTLKEALPGRVRR